MAGRKFPALLQPDVKWKLSVLRQEAVWKQGKWHSVRRFTSSHKSSLISKKPQPFAKENVANAAKVQIDAFFLLAQQKEKKKEKKVVFQFQPESPILGF